MFLTYTLLSPPKCGVYTHGKKGRFKIRFNTDREWEDKSGYLSQRRGGAWDRIFREGQEYFFKEAH